MTANHNTTAAGLGWRLGASVPTLTVSASTERIHIVSALGAAVALAGSALAAELPGWIAMWVIAIGLYAIAKWLSWQRVHPLHVPPWAMAAYFYAWPGLDAAAFLAPRTRPPRPRWSEWFFAVGKLLWGLVLLVCAARWASTSATMLAGWTGLAGIVFTLHFGLFHVLSCLWRQQGFGAPPVMDWPILSQSVSEFWGRRWNRPFRDGMHQFVFRPLLGRWGLPLVSLLAFLFSGCLHELVVTVPARAGWGRPSLYFLIQGLGLLAERTRMGQRLGLGRGAPGWLYAAAVIVLPVGWLFPRPFIVGVIVPFLRALTPT